MHKKTVFLTVFLFLINSLDATVVLSDFDEINATHKLIDYTWKSQSVPRITVKKFPEKIKDVSNGKRLKFFIRTLLPMILMENETIEKEHDFIVKIAAKENWNKNDISIISEIAYKYRIIKKNSDLTGLSEIEKDEIRYFLDHRIRPVPVPIALGQAALESGWGTNRFVFEGNNLFGHVAKDHKKGLKPKNWSGKQRNIRIFDSLQDSISAYMLNLNRNRAYRKFRWLRRKYPGNSSKIAEGFGNYAIIKEEYIGRLQQVITKYGLYRLNDSKLGNGEKAIIHKKIKQIYIN